MHEEPQVPNYGPAGKGTPLTEGMVLAVEPMVNAGRHMVRMGDDGWAIYSQDGSSGRPLRVHDRHHRRRPAHPHPLAPPRGRLRGLRGLTVRLALGSFRALLFRAWGESFRRRQPMGGYMPPRVLAFARSRARCFCLAALAAAGRGRYVRRLLVPPPGRNPSADPTAGSSFKLVTARRSQPSRDGCSCRHRTAAPSSTPIPDGVTDTEAGWMFDAPAGTFIDRIRHSKQAILRSAGARTGLLSRRSITLAVRQASPTRPETTMSAPGLQTSGWIARVSDT